MLGNICPILKMSANGDLSDASNTLTLLTGAIEKNDSKEVQRYLDSLDISKLDVFSSNVLLARLVSKTTPLAQGEVAKLLIEKWRDSNLMELQTPIITQLFAIPFLSQESLTLISSLYPDMTFIRHMTALIDDDSAPWVIQAALRLIDFYSPQSLHVWEELLKYCNDQKNTEDYPNVAMMEIVKQGYEKVAPYAEKPSWIIANASEDKELKDRVCTSLNKEEKENTGIHTLSPAQALDILTDGMIEGDKKDFIQSYDKLTKREQEDIRHLAYHRKRLLQLANNTELYRIFGPSNITYDPSVITTEEANPCKENGGCRMFTCNEIRVYDNELERLGDESEDGFESESSDSNSVPWWFRGNCDFCHRKIIKECYAVRRPLLMGGWEGCYCSWVCVREDDNSDDPLQERMIDVHEKKMLEVGIYDRK